MDGPESGGEGDILEAAAAEVPVEEVVGSGEDLRAAVVAAAVLLGAGFRRVVPHIPGDIEVEAAVPVVVAKRRRGGPPVSRHPGGPGHPSSKRPPPRFR